MGFPVHGHQTTGYRFIKGAFWTRGTNSLGEVSPNNNVDEQNAVLETEQYFLKANLDKPLIINVKCCMSPFLDGTLPESVIPQADKSTTLH